MKYYYELAFSQYKVRFLGDKVSTVMGEPDPWI